MKYHPCSGKVEIVIGNIRKRLNIVTNQNKTRMIWDFFKTGLA